VQLNALFCCLWRNVEASCHKQLVVFSSINTAAYYQQCVITCVTVAVVHPDRVDNTWPVAALTAGRYRLRIAISAYPTCIRRPISEVPVRILLCRFF